MEEHHSPPAAGHITVSEETNGGNTADRTMDKEGLHAESEDEEEVIERPIAKISAPSTPDSVRYGTILNIYLVTFVVIFSFVEAF